MALPGGVPDGRDGDRLGNEGEGVSFRHAVELLRADVPVGESPTAVKLSTVRKLAAPVDRWLMTRRCSSRWWAYYHETLKQSPEALKYLESRGLTNPELIDAGSRIRKWSSTSSWALRIARWAIDCRRRIAKGGRGDARALADARHLSRERA